MKYTATLFTIIYLFAAQITNAQVEAVAQVADLSPFDETPTALSLHGRLFFTVAKNYSGISRKQIMALDSAGQIQLAHPDSISISSMHLLGSRLVFTTNINNALVMYGVDPTTLQNTKLMELSGAYQLAWIEGQKLLFQEPNTFDNPTTDVWLYNDVTGILNRVLTNIGTVTQTVQLTNGTLLLWTRETSTYRLWALAEGTVDGVLIHETPYVFPEPKSVVMGDYAIFAGKEALSRTDGTPNSVFEYIAYSELGLSNAIFDPSLRIGNQLLFMGTNVSDGYRRVLITNGTATGTKQILPNNIPDEAFRPERFFALNGRSFILCHGQSQPNQWTRPLQIWETDGTNTNTQLRAALTPYGVRAVLGVEPAGNRMRLITFAEGTGQEFFMFDGDQLQPTDIWPGNGSGSGFSVINSRKDIGNQTFTGAYGQNRGHELWRINDLGEADLVADLASGARSAAPILLDTIGRWLYWAVKPPSSTSMGIYRFNTQQEPGGVPPPPTPKYTWLQGLVALDIPDGNGEILLPHDISTANSTDLYVSGQYQGGFGIGAINTAQTLTFASGTYGDPTYFIAKLNAQNGQIKWTQWIGGGFYPDPVQLAATPDGGIFAAGTYDEKGKFGGTVIQTSDKQVYLARFDPDGNLLWQREGVCGAKGRVHKVVTGLDEQVWMAGFFFDNTARFGNVVLNSSVSPSYFFVRYDKDGNLINAFVIELPAAWKYFGDGFDMAVRSDGRLVITLGNAWHNVSSSCKFTDYYVRVMTLEPTGEAVWNQTFASDDLTYPTALSLAPEGLIYVAGRFRGEFQVNSTLLSSPCENGRGFLLTIAPDGTVLHKQTTDDRDIAYYDLATDAKGNYYTSGVLTQPEGKRYEGYWGYPSDRYQIIVQKFNAAHQPLSEWTLNKWENGFFEQKPLMALMGEDDIVLHDNTAGPVDTLGEMPHNFAEMSYMVRFKLAPNNTIEPVDNQLLEDMVLLQPNPVADYLMVSSRDGDFVPDQVRFFDILGRPMAIPILRADALTGYWDTRNLPAGIYSMSMSLGQKWISRPFIKVIR